MLHLESAVSQETDVGGPRPFYGGLVPWGLAALLCWTRGPTRKRNVVGISSMFLEFLASRESFLSHRKISLEAITEKIVRCSSDFLSLSLSRQSEGQTTEKLRPFVPTCLCELP